MLVLHPEVDEERRQAVMERVRRAVSEGGGEITGEDAWGRRRLAFKMAGHAEAYYQIVHLRTDGQATSALENALNLAEDVLRHLLVRQEDVPHAEEASSDDEAALPAEDAAGDAPEPVEVVP
jgi:small subunit ribosomal protein S6